MKDPGCARKCKATLLLALVVSLLGCRTTASREASAAKGSVLPDVDGSGGYCVALRGNGDRINALVNSLARTVEHYGTPMALSGGSSASITAFLYESISLNPNVVASPTPTDRALRTSFLLRSIWAYIEMVGASEEGVAMKGLSELSQAPDPLAAIKKTLAESTLGSVANAKEAERMLQDPVHTQDLVTQIRNFGKWDASTPKIFFQPGLIDFNQLARKLGRIGDLYAGRGSFYDEAGMGNLLRQCADPSQGKVWDEAKNIKLVRLDGVESQCGAEFLRLANDYRGKYIAQERNLPFLSRIDEPIGAHVPIIVSTSVTLDPEFIAGWKKSLENYWANRPLDFKPDFSKIKMGYWGSRDDLAAIAENRQGFADEKTRRFDNLLMGRPGASWHEVLRVSPAEPGLAAAQFINDGALSFGGWSDLQPVLVLRNLGCKEVMFLTRRSTSDSTFAPNVATQLGMDADTNKKLFEYSDADGLVSGARLSYLQASGKWCTDWDAKPSLPAPPLAKDSYEAPLVAHSDFFRGYHLPGVPLYNKISGSSSDLPGCSITNP